MISVQSQNTNMVKTSQAPGTATGMQLEQWIGVGLLEDLNGQLADISSQMERQLREKQALREEIETIDALKLNREIQNIEGQSYRDLSRDEAYLLGLEQRATPRTDATGAILGFRVKEEIFQEAVDASVAQRDRALSQLNSGSEMTMIEIQSLVEQRKNALTLLSHLLASSHEVAKSIIGNIGR